MAQAHHAPHRRQTSTTSITERHTRKYPLSPLSKRRGTTYGISRITSTRSQDSVASTSSSEAPRSVLAPLQANLRRRHSRLRLTGNQLGRRRTHSTASELEDDMSVGNKRKRSTSGNENLSAGRLGGGARQMKRQRSETSSRFGSDDETEQGSLMDVDEQSQRSFSSPDDSVQDFDSSDEYWLHEAHSRELNRLRKDELVRLYQAAGLTDDAEALTKNTIVMAIVENREDSVTLPPSSPPGRSNASDCSSDDDEGNTAEDESAFRPSPREVLGRRATVATLGDSSSGPQHSKSRSASLYLPTLDPTSQDPTSRRLHPQPQPSAKAGPSRRRTTSLQDGAHASFLPSPPITRQRSRVPSVASDLSSKGKGKRVEFADSLPRTPRKRSRPPASDGSDMSDLTDIPDDEEGEDANTEATPRPKVRSSAQGTNRRKTPARQAKAKVGSLREESDISTDEELTQSVALSVASRSPTPPSPTNLLGRKTPLKSRLRPRQGTQTHTPPSDGDDEDEEIEEEDDEEVGDPEERPEAMAITPKRLRNGKVITDGGSISPDASDEDVPDGEDEEAVEDVDEVIDDAATLDGDDDEVEELVEEDAEDGEEDNGEDVDLFVASVKTLTRLRRDDLVRMCETRGIDVEGTKPQLAEALLGWRDQQTSAPSSTGTAHPLSRNRPPSTARPPARTRRKSSRNSGQKTPILLRSHIHVEQPHTPPVSAPLTVKEIKEGEDGEPELDLASLGLDDREIPCDKLTKLEKIGSGGFKDVFIGKFKGRKIAIAEFRGQLTAMDIKELKLLGEFDHPNIVRFLGVSIPENTRETPVMVVSELCSNGDLFDYVRNVQPPKLVKVLTLMLDIAKGLEYLHLRKPSVIHRDCKSSNILITSRVTAKIADFGLAKVKQSTRSMVRSLVGTVNWQAPELWSPHPKYNHKVDVFSCAMVFWEMLQWHLVEKKYPWEGMNEHAIYDVVGAKRQRPSVSGLKKQWCPEVVELMERMWAHDHQDRPTMSEVVQELQDLVQLYR